MTTSEIGKHNYARTPFTGSPVASTGIVQAVSTMEATVEKRENSQLQLSPQRNRIFRGGKTVRLQSPFTSTANISGTEISGSSMPSIRAFQGSEGGGDDSRNGDGIDMMAQMQQLFSQQQEEMRRTIETTIVHHIQSLSIAII